MAGPGTSNISICDRGNLTDNRVYSKKGHFYTGLTYLRGYEILKRKLITVSGGNRSIEKDSPV